MNEDVESGGLSINPEIAGWMCAENLERYARAQVARGHAAKLRCYMSYLRRLSAVAPSGVEDVQAWIGLHDRRWGASARRSAVVAVRDYLRWAVRAGVPGAFPPDLLDMPKAPRRLPRPVPDAAAAGAVTAARAAGDEVLTLMLLLAAEAGLRRAEIAGLHTRDLVGGSLYIRGKGDVLRRVRVNDELAALVAGRGDGWVFPSPRRAGRHVCREYVGDRLSAALGPAGTGHQLRHRYATAVYRRTHDILGLRMLLGHASVATTQMYAEVADDGAAAADAARLDYGSS